MGEHRGERRGERTVPIAEAAAVLGISKDAVRMRVKRKTLHSEKRDGRVYVYLNDVPDADANADHTKPAVEASELVEELRDRVRFLEDQLQQANERDRENRRIVAALTSRIPELEAPQESTEAAETVEEEPEEAEPHPDTVEAQATTQHQRAQRPTEGVEHDASTLREWSGDVEGRPQEGVQRRPWWRRMFGG